jgi:hypothetical protein
MNNLPKTAKWTLLLIAVAFISACLFLLWREKSAGILSGPFVYSLRTVVVFAALVAWFMTQSMIGTRQTEDGAIGDGVHDLTARLHGRLLADPKMVSAILIASSLFIDLFGIFLIGVSVFGPTVRPFVALLILFFMRQVCQAFCALPQPPNMIWKDPGVPSLFVTYGVANDFFFSGHTAVAILGAVEIAHVAPLWVSVIAGIIAFLEASVVLVLRAHYTMDVIAAVFAAYFAINVSNWIFALL